MSEMTQLQQAIQAAFPQTELRMEEPNILPFGSAVPVR